MKSFRRITYKVSEKKLKLLILKDPDRIAAIAEEVKGCKGLIIRNKNLNLSAGIWAIINKSLDITEQRLWHMNPEVEASVASFQTV